MQPAQDGLMILARLCADLVLDGIHLADRAQHLRVLAGLRPETGNMKNRKGARAELPEVGEGGRGAGNHAVGFIVTRRAPLGSNRSLVTV